MPGAQPVPGVPARAPTSGEPPAAPDVPVPAGPPPGAVADRALLGSRCSQCAVTVYPAGPTCPSCGGPALPVVLSGTGTVWTWTMQRYAPKSPPYEAPEGEFRPFAVGYVEVPEGVRILAVLDCVRPEDVRIGMPVTVTAGDGVPRALPAGPAGVAT